MSSSNKSKSLIQLALVLGVLFFINVVANFFYGHLDLTEDKRYTLTPATKNLMSELDDIVYIEVFLEGEFPAGFMRLKNSLKDILDDFRSLSGNVQYQFVDPLAGTPEQVRDTQKALKERGILPVNLQVKGDKESKEKLIYPAVFVRYKNRERVVKLLENNQPGIPPQVVLNNSVSLLEYKLTNAIKKMQTIAKHKIAIIEGHGELFNYETAKFEEAVSEFYDIARINLDSITVISDQIKLIVVAKPRGPYSEKHKYMIDQFAMNGGRIMWLIDRFSASLDSLRSRPEYLAVDYGLNLEDIWFKYGFKVNPEMVNDLQCSKIPLQIGMMGNQPQFDLKNWFYSPIIVPDSDHPIVNNLDGIDFNFANTIDTVRTKTSVKKTILLRTSEFSRVQRPPVRLSFEILRYAPDKERFNKPNLPVAVLLEGTFPSAYENRVSEEMKSGLEALGQTHKNKSVYTKMLVVGDGDIIRNGINHQKKELEPLGFNLYERYTFANKDFALNAVEGLIDDSGLIASRSKEVKLRMLNKEKATAESLKWQVVNIVIPLILLMLFGFGYRYFRQRRYA